MSESTIRGVDVGSYVALTNAGVKYYDYDGKEQPLMKILKDNGVNYIRLRIWNDPYNEKGETYGGGDSTVDNGLKIGKEATKYGMKVLVDFHYSDFWADPAKRFYHKHGRRMLMIQIRCVKISMTSLKILYRNLKMQVLM